MNWTVLNLISVLVYGTLLTLSCLEIKPTWKNSAVVAGLSFCCLLVQSFLVNTFGFDAIFRAYPLIVHLPLFLLCVFFFRKSPAASLFSLLTAYVLTVPRNWIGNALAVFFPGSEAAPDILRTAATIPLLILLLIFWTPRAREFLRQRNQTLWIMAIPFELFYALSYITTVYTNLLLESNILVIGFVMTLLSLLLCILASVVGKQNEQVLTLHEQQDLLKMQSSETEKRLEEIHDSQQKMRILRHDMRHYFQMIDDYAAKGNTAEIRSAIHQIQKGIEDTAIRQYCLNEQVNLAISSFVRKAEKQGIDVAVNADVPEKLDESLTLDLCILLANAMENAATAAADTKDAWIRLNCGMVSEKLVIQVSNSCEGDIFFLNGIPKSRRAGHGFGAYSIAALAERHGGTADFSCRDGVFMVRAVL